ncbi:MAG: ABC transporter permease [Niameybacter sp.]|uniref:ABC transporter permease n=1 Tax=Niameybacter sp. TaxID=2033640 RepID=UPI002FC6DE8A
MRKKGWMYLILLVGLELIKYNMVAHYVKDYGTGNIVAYLQAGDGTSYEHFKRQESYERLQPTVLSQKSGTIQGKSQRRVEVIATNGYLPSVQPLSMKNGAFFSEEAVAQGNNVVVISDVLAESLFGGEEAAGNLCKIEGIYYQVVGVYEKYKSWTDILLDNGQEKIYLPFRSSVAEEWVVENLILTPQNEAGEALSIYDLEDLTVSREENVVFDLLDRKKTLINGTRLPMAILGIIGMYRLVKNCGREMQKLQGKTTKSVVQSLLKVVLNIGCMWMVYRLTLTGFYISKQGLPPNNLFDISFYVEQFKAQCIQHNYLAQYALFPFEGIYTFMGNRVMGIGIVEVVCIYKWRKK